VLCSSDPILFYSTDVEILVLAGQDYFLARLTPHNALGRFLFRRSGVTPSGLSISVVQVGSPSCRHSDQGGPPFDASRFTYG